VFRFSFGFRCGKKLSAPTHGKTHLRIPHCKEQLAGTNKVRSSRQARVKPTLFYRACYTLKQVSILDINHEVQFVLHPHPHSTRTGCFCLASFRLFPALFGLQKHLRAPRTHDPHTYMDALSLTTNSTTNGQHTAFEYSKHNP
jgi:hypothetical protein